MQSHGKLHHSTNQVLNIIYLNYCRSNFTKKTRMFAYLHLRESYPLINYKRIQYISHSKFACSTLHPDRLASPPKGPLEKKTHVKETLMKRSKCDVYIYNEKCASLTSSPRNLVEREDCTDLSRSPTFFLKSKSAFHCTVVTAYDRVRA